MTTRPLSAIVSDVRTRAKAVTEQTSQLVKAQLRKDGGRIATGSGLIVAALAAVCIVPPLLLVALVLGLVAMGIWSWAACLIVAGAALALAVGLALAAKSIFMRLGKSTHQTIEQVKGTMAAFRGSKEAEEPEA
ncbi:MAG: phage holin family protein [Micrococcales bacterium]|nr:phage holin family protein [Micrococcales bacterium]